ncbi:MAG TPA: CerR family C-terminal domain-containing protein [Burkholderiaceae bacterium]
MPGLPLAWPQGDREQVLKRAGRAAAYGLVDCDQADLQAGVALGQVAARLQVWAREVLAPSPMLDQLLREDAQPKFEVLRAIVIEITGQPPQDPCLLGLTLDVVAPCLMLLVVDRNMATPFQPLFQRPAQALATQMWSFAMAGLRAVRGHA